MRRAILVLALLLLPSAAAAGFDLAAPKRLEGVLDPGAATRFEMPLQVAQAGELYAKVLPTPGNAVNDGSAPNGSLEPASGWRVAFALVRADGARVEMGTFVDSTLSVLVPVSAGESPRLEMTVHAPEDALAGGAEQTVYVAIAHRAEATDAASASGGRMDASRAVTLVLRHEASPTETPATAPPAPQEDEAVPEVSPIPPQESLEGGPTPRSADATPSLPWVLTVLLLAGVAGAVGRRR